MKLFKPAFTLAEMLVVILIIGIVCVVAAPVVVLRFKRDTVAPLHGSFECFYDDYNNIQQVIRDGDGNITSSEDVTSAGQCVFQPNIHSMFFIINAVGGGSGGAGTQASFVSATGNEDYTDSITQHKDYLFGIGDTVDFSKYNNDDWSWVYETIKKNGISVDIVITSDGGSTVGTIQRAENNTSKEECNVDNPSYNLPGTAGCYTYSYWANAKAGASGGRYIFNATVGQGSALTQKSSNGVGVGISNTLDNKHIGCFAQNGDDGCYNYGNTEYPECSPNSYSAVAYDSGYTCSPLKSSKTGGGAYSSPASQISWYDDDSACTFSTCELSGEVPHGLSTCSMNFCATVKVNPLQSAISYGSLALVYRELNRGVNYYAESGNAGDYKSMYIPKFKKSVIIKPGYPGTRASAGGSTILKYKDDNDADAFMIVSGGDAPDTDNSIIVGRHFERQNVKVTVADKDSSSSDSYGDYFNKKDSGFIHPIMSDTQTIPDTVGDSGMGGYSIYRTIGPSDNYTITTGSGTTSKDESPTSVDTSSYTCIDTTQTISGANRYCLGQQGKGGAVVISW